MRISVSYKRELNKVSFPDASRISHTRLAKLLGVTRQRVEQFLKTGDVPEKYIKQLRSIKLVDIIREPRKTKEGA